MRKITFVCYCPSVDCESVEKDETTKHKNEIEPTVYIPEPPPPPPPPLPVSSIVPPKIQIFNKEDATIHDTSMVNSDKVVIDKKDSFISEIIEKRNSIIKNNV